MHLTDEQIERYSRQIALKELGTAGQERLMQGSVLIIGAGGLGSPAALYLAAAGVGKIGIADADAVDLSNLQRQILHTTKDLGRPKVESARNSVQALNPETDVRIYQDYVSADNIREIMADYDFVLDATDNFSSKFLINDACVLDHKPFCHAGILGFQGQLMTYLPGSSPCCRCLFQTPPPPDVAQASRKTGVLGAVPGVIGSLEAAEAIKYLTGVGELLTGRLLTFDARTMAFRTVPVVQNPECSVCGQHPSITELHG